MSHFKLFIKISELSYQTIESFYRAAAEGDIEKALSHISFSGVTEDDMQQTRNHLIAAINTLRHDIAVNDRLETVQIKSIGSDYYNYFKGFDNNNTDKINLYFKLIFSNGKRAMVI